MYQESCLCSVLHGAERAIMHDIKISNCDNCSRGVTGFLVAILKADVRTSSFMKTYSIPVESPLGGASADLIN